MAGDHKCPVCQATFTRPQHVARHMRSHTGDRPYKCQHCGDQFARSDLLSRHVNKCHAGDKPPTTTAPTRRKGQHGSSSTRATTSKQACDQCVMATLPCDGANPCSKCVQRKMACTYVKFQRQTAPSGPGHKHSHSVESTSSMSSTLSIPRPDELFLGPPPMTVPSMAGDLYYPSQTQFAFNPPGARNWEDSPNPPPSLTLSSSAADSGQESSSSEIAARYRTAEMLRASMLPPGYAANSGLLPNNYGNYPPAGPSEQWQVQTEFMPQGQYGELKRRDKDIQESFSQYLPAGPSTQMAGPAGLLHPSNFEFQGGGLYNLHARRGSVDGYSDGGSGASGPNSATSSSAHLPLEYGPGDQQQQPPHQPLDFSAYPAQFDDGQRPPPSREGRFASSFGLMSLADGDGTFIGNFNNSEGNAPFFTNTAMKLPPQDSTPRPFRTDDDLNQFVPATGNARDREAEMRELREFWKQYLRTPLTGPSLGQTPKAELINNQLGALGERPTPKRGLSRVASLPSVRTPPEEKPAALPSRLNPAAPVPTPGNRVMQTADDLKSYEQAVLARKAPLNLSLAPRKGRLSNASSVSPSASPAMSHQRSTHDRVPGTFIEPGPKNIPSAGITGISSLQDRPVSADRDTSMPDNRPSFKRLPSQTLENTVQKRALFSWNGDGNEDTFDDTDSDQEPPARRPSHPNGNGHAPYLDNSFDRYRRQSAPTAVRPDLGSGHNNNFPAYNNEMNAHHAHGGAPGAPNGVPAPPESLVRS